MLSEELGLQQFLEDRQGHHVSKVFFYSILWRPSYFNCLVFCFTLRSLMFQPAIRYGETDTTKVTLWKLRSSQQRTTLLVKLLTIIMCTAGQHEWESMNTMYCVPELTADPQNHGRSTYSARSSTALLNLWQSERKQGKTTIYAKLQWLHLYAQQYSEYWPCSKLESIHTVVCLLSCIF